MNSLRGIPVEHKLETFSMPSTATTSCHPKNWLCRSERNPALDTLAISPLAHINGDTHTLLQIPDTKLDGDFKHIPHKSNNTLPSQHPAKPFHLKHPTSLNTTSLAAPKTNQIFKAANKELSLLCVVKAKCRNSFVCLKKNIVLNKITISLIAIHLWVITTMTNQGKNYSSRLY